MKTELQLVGRESELSYLETMYGYDASQIVVLYGERHLGKHYLIQKFCENKEHIFLCAQDCTETLQLDLWCRELDILTESKTPVERRYDEIFNRILFDSKDKKVIIIDEFQLLSKNSDHFISDLFDYLYKMRDGQELFFILCSCDINWIEQNIPNECEHAAYDFSGVLRIQPLPVSAMKRFYPELSIEACVGIYSLLGGYAGLWNLWNSKKTYKENFQHLLLEKTGPLYMEAQNCVSFAFREPGAYQTILHAIANGNIQLNEIHHSTGFVRAKVSVYLTRLMQCGILDKEHLFETEPNETARNGIYHFKYPYVAIWFRVVFGRLSLLAQLDTSVFYDKMILPILNELFHSAFDHCCIEYFEWMNQNKMLPISCQMYGKMIGKYGMIDLAAMDSKGQKLVCLFKWSDKKLDFDDYEWLQYCCKREGIEPIMYYLFSMNGFHDELLLERNQNNNITLIDIKGNYE